MLQLRTQIQRETLLAKEAKYEHGLKKNDYEYDELLGNLRENNNASRNERSVGELEMCAENLFFYFTSVIDRTGRVYDHRSCSG